MAWETWKTSSAERKLLSIACSILLIALFVLAAWVLDLTVPYLPLAIAGGLVFYLRNWPAVEELIAWLAISLGFGLIVRFPHDHNWINTGAGVMSLFGLGAFLMLGLRWLWSTGAERRKTYAVLAPGAAMVLFVLSAQRALSLANVLYAKTFDLYLYVFDGSLGFQPSFLMGRAMAASSLLRVACLLTYISLALRDGAGVRTTTAERDGTAVVGHHHSVPIGRAGWLGALQHCSRDRTGIRLC